MATFLMNTKLRNKAVIFSKYVIIDEVESSVSVNLF